MIYNSGILCWTSWERYLIVPSCCQWGSAIMPRGQAGRAHHQEQGPSFINTPPLGGAGGAEIRGKCRTALLIFNISSKKEDILRIFVGLKLTEMPVLPAAGTTQEYLSLGYQNPSQSVRAHRRPQSSLIKTALQVKHGDAGAEEL